MRVAGSALLVATIHLGCAAALRAQPWVPPQGEGTVSVTYQNYYVIGHFDRQGHKNKNGATHAKAMVATFDYALTDSVAITATLPFIATRYTGPPMYLVGGVPTFPGPLDDRSYHGTFQDLQVEVRRVWWAGPVAVAPLLGGTLPTHDYETHGEAVAGKHRREVQIGASAAPDLGAFLPKAYTHVRYALAVAERIDGFESVRSTIDLEGGYDLTARVAVRALTTWQVAHKGPMIADLAAHDWAGHDRFIVASYFNAGGGLTLSLTNHTELNAVWIGTVSGRGGAHQARMLAVGLSWSFGSRMAGFPTVASAATSGPSRSSRRGAGFGT